MLLLIGAALLVAQAVNFAFILNEQQKLSLARNEGPAIGRFTQAAAVIAATAPEARVPLLSAHRMEPAATYRLVPRSAIDREGIERNGEIEQRLASVLREARVPVRAVRAASPMGVARIHEPPRHGHHEARRLLLLAAQLDDGSWLDARFDAPRADRWLIHRLVLATAMLFVLVFGAAWWIARRLAFPLRDLTRAAEGFRGHSPAEPVEPSGPSDLRRAVEAFNAMNRRTLALLDEKDRMLGAIGHDLRTPLASLRIRAEGVEPENERQRMVATIDEMHAMLEDILVLARSGRARETERAMDVTALADTLVEEYRELGHDVALEPSDRQVLTIQPNLMRRAIRNLVDNALKYGGSARVTVRSEGGNLLIEVRDSGPGLPPEQLQRVLEPFYRVEESRSRETGVGLAIARAIAESHGGALNLENAPGNGLIAGLAIPAEAKAQCGLSPE
jgi:signal transduction histidine kinase